MKCGLFTCPYNVDGPTVRNQCGFCLLILQKISLILILTRISTSNVAIIVSVNTHKTQAGSYYHLHLIEEESEFGGKELCACNPVTRGWVWKIISDFPSYIQHGFQSIPCLSV